MGRACPAPARGASGVRHGWRPKRQSDCPVPCGERMSLISMDSFLKDKDTANPSGGGPKKTGAIRQFLTDVQWGALDYLVYPIPLPVHGR